MPVSTSKFQPAAGLGNLGGDVLRLVGIERGDDVGRGEL
jgi:hypothetical protein